MDNIIEISNLCYSYEDEDNYSAVIENLNLYIERGSFTVILGHNGSGKSTLAKLLNGLYRPTSGTVKVNDILTTDEQKEFEIKKTVGMVFQNPDNQLVASVVEEDVAFGPENLGIEPAEIRERVDFALKSVGMYEYKDSS
ncbi:MAG: ATP-binding cassette domain-containing protein, partial [Clostridia bacterium]|nr:ATP-binding cassette domain-containing protein [Clostridia bacterium]